MEAGRWRQLRAHLEAALEISDPHRRQAYVHEVAESELQEDLQRLLARHAQTHSALDQAAPKLIAHVMAAKDDDDTRKQNGRRIGAFALDEMLGSGGMGSVYRAHRVEGGFEQVVAIKLLLYAHPGLRERFRKEQRILAGLNHPAIAQLLDGGETDDGTPFIAMEYVSGESIADYCRNHLPAVEDRLKMLLSVASALSYAHRNLVIHRDIKPTNVLVSHSEGHAKLVDFGIAKLVDEEGLGKLTRQNLGPMTPAYAAPEQFKGGAITVATDIYQFGVLMFKLITGRLPFDADLDDPIAWGRAVLESEPMTLGRALASVRRAQDVRLHADAVRAISRELNRDLDAIVRQAIAKEPQHRYGSMDALIADLEAFLDGRPVQARHGGNWYHFSRFVSRHRFAVAMSASAVVLLVALTAFAMVQTARARADAERARLSAEFMEAVLKAADPLTSKKAIQTALDLMDAANENMRSKFGARPDLSAPTTILIANAYANLGAISRAYPMYIQALRDLRSNQVQPIDLARALERAAFAAERNGQLQQSKAWLDEFEQLLQQTDTLETRKLREGMIATRWQMARDAGDLPRALVLAEQGLANLAGFETHMQAERQLALRRRGVLYTDMGQYPKAEHDLRASFELAMALFGAKHARTAIIQQSLGWHYVSAGSPKRGLEELIAVAETVREVFGEVSQVYGANLHNRGNAYVALKMPEFALESYQKSAEAYRGSTSNSSIQVGSALVNVAEILRLQGKLARAKSTFEEVEQAWLTAMPADAPARAPVYLSQAKVAYQLGLWQSATKYALRSIEIYRAGPNHSELAQALAWQGKILVASARKSEAVVAYQEAIRLLQAQVPLDQPALKAWQDELAALGP